MKLSIIIPVYNAEKYIGWCLDSCLNIGGVINNDYEIICVNDGSSDNSIEIIKQYENKGIKVLTKPNGGVSSARNLGLEKAQGDYVWFVDADDMIVPNSFKTIINYQSGEIDVLKIQASIIQANTPPTHQIATNAQ